MAVFAAANVTVVVTETQIVGRKRHVWGTLTFGDGALTYEAAGIPLPAISACGLTRQLDMLTLTGINARTTDYLTRYNKAAHKLQLFEEEAAAAGGPLLEADVAEAPAARTYDFYAIGW